MKAVVLAGGYGTRLRPLTCTKPKPVVTLLGKPVLSYILEWLHAAGVEEAVLTTAYLPDCIDAFLAYGTPAGMRVRTVREHTPLGTAGSVKAAAGEWDEPFFVVSGDCICDFDLRRALEFHLQSRAEATIVTTRVRDPREYGLVYADEHGHVTGFCEKPDWNGVAADAANTGIYVLSPAALHGVPTEQPFDFSCNLFPELLRDGAPLYAYAARGYWCDIGDLSAYRACQRDMLDGRVRLPLPAVADGIYAAGELPQGEYQLIPPVYIGAHVAIERGAAIGPYTVVGDGCYIGKNAKLTGSVLLEDAAVYDNAVVNFAVICENAALKSGAQVYEDSAVGARCVLGSSARIGPNVKLWPEKRIENGARVAHNVKYGAPRTALFSERGICGLSGVELGPAAIAAVGRSLASCSLGGKIGVATDAKPLSRAAYHILAGSMATQGSSVWNFGDCFLTQMYFFTAFCSLQMGVFISSGAGKVRLHLCSTGGLPLPRGVEREIEARCKNDDFTRVSPQSCKEISDMASMQAMYLRELTREAGVPLQRQCVGVQCKNERVQMLVEDCLYRLGAKSGDEVTLRFGADGTTVSAFHRTCGWITHDKLLTLCCKADLEAGRDVALQTEAPYTITRIARACGRRALRYGRSPVGEHDRDARRLAQSCLYTRDALFLSIRLLGILQQTGKTLDELVYELPAFYVSRKSIPIGFSPTELLEVLGSKKAAPQEEGVALQTDKGRVLLVPQRSGKRLYLLAEAASFEASRELCGDVEAYLQKAGRTQHDTVSNDAGLPKPY